MTTHADRFDATVRRVRELGWAVEVSEDANGRSAMATCGTEKWYDTPMWLTFGYSKHGFVAGRLYSPKNSARPAIDHRNRNWVETVRDARVHAPVITQG